MRARVLRSIREIEPSLWDSLCADVAFSHGWFSALEESQVVAAKPRHLVLEQDGHVVGILPCFIQYGDPYYTLADRLFGPLNRWLRRCGIRVLPALLAYSPLVHRTELFLSPGVDRGLAIRACTEAMERICQEERLPLSGWLFTCEADESLLSQLRQGGHSEAFLCPTAIWTNRYATFEEYMQDIKGRSRNSYKGAHKELNRAKQSGVEFAQEPLSAISSQELSEMRGNFYARYKPGVTNPFSPEFFDALKRGLDGRVIAHTARKDGKLLRYCISLKGAERWHEFIDGHVNDDRSHNNALYFNLNYYYPIRQAITEGITQLDFGLSDYTAKAKRGCAFESLHMSLRAHRRFLRWGLPVWMHFVHAWYKRKHRSLEPYRLKRPREKSPGEWTLHDPPWRKPLLGWRQLGIRQRIQMAGRKLIKPVLQKATIMECRTALGPYRRIPVPEARVHAQLRRLGEKELALLRSTTSRAMYRRFEQFVCQHFRCYVACIDGQVVSYTWYTERPYRNPVSGITFPLGPREMFSVYSHTLRACRNRGISTQLRAFALSEFQQEGIRAVGTSIDDTNVASFRALIPWGFKPCRQYRYQRILGRRSVSVEPLKASTVLLNRLGGSRPLRAPYLGETDAEEEKPSEQLHKEAEPVVIIILNHNKREQALRCLQQVSQLDYAPYEVVLVDNGSTDGSAQAVEQNFPQVHLIRNATNVGAASGRNLALAYADKHFSYKYVFCLDNDAFVEPGALRQLVDTAASDARIGLATPKIYTTWVANMIQCAGGHRINLCTGSIRAIGTGELDRGEYNQPRWIRSAPGVLLIKREVFSQVGWYDERFDPYGWEDVDLSLRAAKVGFKIRYAPQAVIHHQGGKKNRGDRALAYEESKAKNFLLLMKEHASPLQWVCFVCVLPFKATVRVIQEAYRGKVRSVFAWVRGVFRLFDRPQLVKEKDEKHHKTQKATES